MIYQRLARPALFRLGGGDAERAHEWTLRRLAALSRRPAALRALRATAVRGTPRTVFGLRFPNPVGLAAGMDKDGRALPAWAALGFGFVEVGTVTARPQPGNPRPRVFRLPAGQGVINRMGFNNEGAAALATRLATLRPLGIPLGVSLGKSKVVPLADAVEDYLAALRAVLPHADYVAVNVSSPNTPGLRSLQFGDSLKQLLADLATRRAELALRHGKHVPLAIKIAPDMTDEETAQVAQALIETGMDAVIATNTTLSRVGVEGMEHGDEAGGLSGAPVRDKSTHTVKVLAAELGGRLPIIAAGGITEGKHAAEKIVAGASLVQIYSGFIYKGPALIRESVDAIAALR